MKRKLIAIFMTIAMLTTMVPVAFAADLSSESTAEVATQNLTKVNGVYQIGSAADLQAFSALVNGGETSANAELTANINLDNAVFTPIGNANENSITYAYRGTFDGKGFTISHATIASAYNMGIFGFVENGTVKKSHSRLYNC